VLQVLLQKGIISMSRDVRPILHAINDMDSQTKGILMKEVSTYLYPMWIADQYSYDIFLLAHRILLNLLPDTVMRL
jgi:hypothetical protein